MFEIMQYAEVGLAVLLILVVLIQNKNVSLNLSTMGGGMGAVTKRGPEKVLHNTTILLGGLFIINSLLLFILSK
ncbi:MAG: preprotein translocase subunit SecG [Candidatus Gracilibacteria bacterium]|nr:preprotein translocase subunit SecG [Candidatus Gracilibacteria bacterium]